MPHLTWKFDWAQNQASATATHGTYLITAEGDKRWGGRFVRSATASGASRKYHGDPLATIRYFPSLADAVRACQSHCERFSPHSSDRLSIKTPRPHG
jgi:hypothetical protein